MQSSIPPPDGYMVLFRCPERRGAYEPVDFGHELSEMEPAILLRRDRAGIFPTREAAEEAIARTLERGREVNARWAKGLKRQWVIWPCYLRT